jgi:hypothetical protein
MNIAEIAAELRTRHGCHTAILYGSHARGDAGPASDYDAAGFAPITTVMRDARRWRGLWLDLFIYPEGMLLEPDIQLLKLRGGRVLFERDDEGSACLQRVERLFESGPEPLAADEAAARRAWAWKMLERAARGDPEGHYRRAWLLTALLEDYFLLRGNWYQGPKQSLEWLSRHDVEAFAAAEAALLPDAPLGVLRAWVEAAVGADQD